MSDIEQQLQVSLERLHKLLLDSNFSVGFAESCTGGLLSSYVTSQPGASKYFWGSVVSYHGDVKRDVLSVGQSSMETHGQVSQQVAQEMARGAKKALGVDWSVSVTGIAGPGGGTPEKPVGTVCFAVCGPNIERVHQESFKSEERRKIQLESVKYAIDFLWDSINT